MTAGRLRALVDSAEGTPEEGAFIIAQDAQPNLDLDRYRTRLDGLADRVVEGLDRSSNLRAQIAALAETLYNEHEPSNWVGLRGNRDAYYDPRNSYLNAVLDRGLGIPISLAIVILGVARRAGIVAQPIGFPGHFLVRIGGPGGVLVDPFDRARIVSARDLADLARRVLSSTAQVKPSHLEPVGLRGILMRMLSNLRAIHEQRGDHRNALLVCDRLVELDAGAPALRDRGLHALALGAPAAAASDLQAYLSAAPEAPDRSDVERALARASAAPNWN